MPFTPFHMGPGLAFKAVTGRKFSFLTFGIAQVVMDIEPLVGLWRGASILHGWTHTLLAACVLAFLIAVASPPLSRLLLRRWNGGLVKLGLSELVEPGTLSKTSVITGAVVGTVSHVILDSIMHADMSPLAPWSDSNGLLGVVPVATLHWFCLAAGGAGMIRWFFRAWLRKKSGVKP